MFDKTPKDNGEHTKATGYQTLLDSQWAKFHQTTALEWKINFSVWGLLAFFCYISAKCRVNFFDCPFNGVLLILSIVGLHWYWMMLVQRSKAQDFDRALAYRRACEDSLGLAERQKTDPLARAKDSRGRSWAAIPVAVTLILLMALFTVSTKNCKKNCYRGWPHGRGQVCDRQKSMHPDCPILHKGSAAHPEVWSLGGGDDFTGVPEKV